MSTSWAQHIAERSAQTPQALAFEWQGKPRLFWVSSGAIDVFLAPTVTGGLSGARYALCRVTAGQAFLCGALPVSLANWTAIAVPLPGTRIVEVHGALTTLADAAPALGTAIGQWLNALGAAVRQGFPPARYEVLDERASLSLGIGEACSSTVTTIWAEVVSGEVLFLGHESLRLGTGALVPIHPEGWVTASSASNLRAVAFRMPRNDERILEQLSELQGKLIEIFCSERAEDDRRFADRLLARSAASKRRLTGALGNLAGALDSQLAPVSSIGVDDPVLAACQIVGKSLGIQFPDLPRIAQPVKGADRVRAAAEAAHVRQRRVALRGAWWNVDNGPLVGFIDASGAPVALLRDSAGYLAVSPEQDTQIRVDATYAAALAPFAYSFFRTLPPVRLRFRDLLAFALHGRWPEIRFILTTAIMLGLLGTVSPIAIGFLFDKVIPSADRGLLLQMTAVLLGAAAVTFFFTVARALMLLRLETITDASLQAAIWDRVLKLPVTFFRRYTAGDLATRINSINAVRRQLSGTTLSAMLSGLFSALNLALIFYYSSQLAWLALGMVFLAILVNAGAGWLILRSDRPLAELQGQQSGLVLQFLSGIAKLRVAAAEPRAFALWAARFAEARSYSLKAQFWRNAAEVALPTLATIAVSALFFAMGHLRISSFANATNGQLITTGAFVALVGAFAAFFVSFVQFSDTLYQLLEAVPQLERARPILEATPEITPARSQPGELRGAVLASNLVFRYRPDATPVLDGVSFDVKPGEFIAIVGPSGAGKSTLLRLLLGFEQPEGGSIYFDGQALYELDAQAVRRQFGVVLQSSGLMPGDIFTNIVGSRPLSLEDAWEAARLCGLDSEIEAMPMGMHTVISEGASTFSGGQRQRIAIARAIVHRPRVLLFDEATSALDNEAQAQVARSLERLKATRIVIAHRLSTIRHADRILVLDRGRLVQAGKFDDLIVQPGLFADMARRQLA